MKLFHCLTALLLNKRFDNLNVYKSGYEASDHRLKGIKSLSPPGDLHFPNRLAGGDRRVVARKNMHAELDFLLHKKLIQASPVYLHNDN